jgi:riboflavin kinase/FMN adenylyltransferase
MGVPTPGCHCRVCSSTDPHDKRLRPSLLLSRNGQYAVIDTTPDFRQQALRAHLDRLDAVLLTHAHADHVMGFDDIRPYTLRQNTVLPVYSNAPTFEVLRRAFAYVFDGLPKQSSIPSVKLHELREPFELLGIAITPIPLLHGDLEVLGYRFERAAYLTDFSSIADSSLALLQGLDELILDALRDEPHPMHQTVDQALAIIETLKPRRAWFTHIAHDLGHVETNERLRQLGYPSVQLAYDGLELEIPIHDSDVAHKPGAPHARTERSERVGFNGAASSGPALSPTSIQVFSSSESWAEHYASSARGSALAIGNFDGAHLGHQAILNAAVARSQQLGAIPTVLTFDPLPPKILRPDAAPLRLATNDQRTGYFAAANMQAVVVLPFTHDLSRLSPEEFVQRILVGALHARAVFIGENFRFGHRQAGDARLLQQLGLAHGFEVHVLPHIAMHHEVVSSTRVRREIALGQVSRAARLLGRPFVLSGKVVPGTATGRRLTFPTLNLAPDQELLPARGVYITRTQLPGEAESRPSVTNIGIRPTFDASSLTVETHILDPLEGVPPPEQIAVQFCHRLREEKKFASPDELRAQITLDIARARRFFDLLQRFRSHSPVR